MSRDQLRETRHRLVSIKEALLRVSKRAHDDKDSLKHFRRKFDNLVHTLEFSKTAKELFLDISLTFSLSLHAHHLILDAVWRQPGFINNRKKELFAPVARLVEVLSSVNEWFDEKPKVLTTVSESKRSLNKIIGYADSLSSISHKLALDVKKLHNNLEKRNFEEEMLDVLKKLREVMLFSADLYVSFFQKVCFTAIYHGDEKWFESQKALSRKGLIMQLNFADELLERVE